MVHQQSKIFYRSGAGKLKTKHTQKTKDGVTPMQPH
jgi:hypothetical protein